MKRKTVLKIINKCRLTGNQSGDLQKCGKCFWKKKKQCGTIPHFKLTLEKIQVAQNIFTSLSLYNMCINSYVGMYRIQTYLNTYIYGHLRILNIYFYDDRICINITKICSTYTRLAHSLYWWRRRRLMKWFEFITTFLYIYI